MIPYETKELAYKVWCECEQNLSECHRRMNGHEGYVITRQSLYEWMEKYDWQGRATRLEADQALMVDATSDDSILTPLLRQKTRYESYFDSLAIGAVDNQAVYGYNAILKTILEIREKMEDRKREGEVEEGGAGVIIKTPADAIIALENAVNNKLNAMLAHKGTVSLKNVKDMQKALLLIDKMRTKYVKETKDKSKRSGLTDKAALDIQQKILGMDES
jgi:hypothetical protein